MGEDLRIGLIGCGAMGQGHLDVWTGIAGARVSAVCDPDADRARAASERSGARAFDDLDEMLASGAIDAVDIATPSGLHAEQGLAAARRDLHVLCEKPLDLSLARAERLVLECEHRGLTLGCIFQRRTYPGAIRVAEAVAGGEMGAVLSCSAYVKWWRPQSYYDSSGWRGSWALDGGVLANQAIHAIDHVCWLAGPVAQVEYAYLGTEMHRMEAEDHAVAVVRFLHGGRGVIEATTCCSPPLCTRLELMCSAGAAAFDDANVVSFGARGEDLLATVQSPPERVGGRCEPMAISMAGHRILLTDFVESVKTGKRPLVSGRDALMSVQAVHLIYAKALPNAKLGL